MAMEPGKVRARGERCRRCQGQGKVPVLDRGRLVQVRCPECKGERFQGPPLWTK